MINSQEFNPFNILPQPLMLQILLQTFTENGQCSLDSILDYQKANQEFATILSDESNFKYIFSAMPTEFNIGLITTLKKRKIHTEEGRYRAGLALLFLKYLYEHVKPFPNDEFLVNHYNDYLSSFKYLQEYYIDYPMPMYVSGMVAFYIAKRLFTLDPFDLTLREKGTEIYKIAIDCIKRADELEHPLAKIFYSDMSLQLQRVNVRIEDYVSIDPKKVVHCSTADLIAILSEDTPIEMSSFDDEIQTLITVTWRKLTIENIDHARDLIKFTYQKNKLKQITEFFYSCYQINHFHRYSLAYNPLFVHNEHHENLLFLLEKFSVDSLLTLHQAFRVHHPIPDSILLSTLLMMNHTDLSDFKILISVILSFPQNENSEWRICFHEAYRNAIDEGILKTVSTRQMKMILHYLILVNEHDFLNTILERDANILGCIFHCTNDQVQDIAKAVYKQIVDFAKAPIFSQLHHQEILLKVVYKDAIFLSRLKIPTHSDITKIATTIVETFSKMLAPKIPTQKNLSVCDYFFNNKPLFRGLTDTIHEKLSDYTAR